MAFSYHRILPVHALSYLSPILALCHFHLLSYSSSHTSPCLTLTHTLSVLASLLLCLINLGGQDEVTLGQAVDRMCVYLDLRFAPGEADVRMVALGLGHGSDLRNISVQ